MEIFAYLDSSSGNVAIMRLAGGEGWAVVESELGLSLGHFELSMECVDLIPVGQHFFFLRGEVRLVRH